MREFTAPDGAQGMTLCNYDQRVCLSVTTVSNDPGGNTIRIHDEHGNVLIANPAEVSAFVAEATEALSLLGVNLPEMSTATA